MKLSRMLGTGSALVLAFALGAAEHPVTNKLYSEKGEAGKQVISQQQVSM